jgi:hypothetical protein
LRERERSTPPEEPGSERETELFGDTEIRKREIEPENEAV